MLTLDIETLLRCVCLASRGQGYLMMGALVHAVSEAFPAADNPKGCSNQVAEVAGKALSTLGSAFLVDNDRSSVASAIEAATDVLKIGERQRL